MAARVDASNKAIEAFAAGADRCRSRLGVMPLAAQAMNEAAFGPSAGRLFFEGAAWSPACCDFRVGLELCWNHRWDNLLQVGRIIGRTFRMAGAVRVLGVGCNRNG